MKDLVLLGTLAHRINAEHHACEKLARSTVDHALEAGHLLYEAKDLCEHGDWGAWLSGNFEGSERTAQLYMRLYRRRPELEAKAQRVADLPLREAVRLLADPREEAAPESPRLVPAEGCALIGKARGSGAPLDYWSRAGEPPDEWVRYVVWIIRFRTDPDYLFVSVIDGLEDTMSGLKRPMSGGQEMVHHYLEMENVPIERAEWEELPHEGWEWNEMLFATKKDHLLAWVAGWPGTKAHKRQIVANMLAREGCE
jgi:hypothetical protein